MRKLYCIPTNSQPEYLMAAQTAARVHLAERNVEDAIRVLEEATTGPRARGWWAPASFGRLSSLNVSIYHKSRGSLAKGPRSTRNLRT
jgi:hypothetical protein